MQVINRLMNFRFTSLRTRITFIAVGLAISPLIIVGMIIGIRSFTRLESQSLALHRQVAESVGSKIKALVDQRVNELRLLDVLHSLARQPRNGQRATMSTLLFQQPTYQELVLLDAQGRESIRLSRSDVRLDHQVPSRAERDEFRIPFNQRVIYFSSVRFDAELGEPILTIGLPLSDLQSDKIAAVLVADLRFKMVWELLVTLASSFQQSEVYVTDEHGRIVAHRNPTIVLQRTRYDLPEIDGRGTGLSQQSAIIARDVLQLGMHKLIVVAEQPLQQALALATENLYMIIVLTAVALLLASVLVILIMRRTVKPIEELGVAARTLSSGDFSVRVPLSSRDEIGQLAFAFNQMVDNLKQVHDTLEEQVQERTAALEQKNTQLNQEIAERQQLETQMLQAQKMQAVGTLAGGIAHEFNNNLAVILGFTELATDQLPPTAPVHHRLQAVLTAGNRAKDLVQQILTFSRQSQPRRQAVSLEALVRESLSLVRVSLPSTIAIESYIAADAGKVLADPTQVQQILMNLCGNAEHAMRQTGGRLKIEVTRANVSAHPIPSSGQRPQGDYVRFMIQDTGVGMSAEVASRVFEPFFTTKEIGEGTGMGLAIVHGIVTSYGGEIQVLSTPGAGSTFTIYLPRLADATEAMSAKPAGAIDQGKGCILWVDDEPLLLRMGQEMLVKLGYEVVAHMSSREALETFRAMPYRFDLVITDQTMPILAGERLAKELRHIRADIPIVLCTGFSHVIDAEKAAATGINAFCMKPVEMKALARTIEQVLGRGRQN